MKEWVIALGVAAAVICVIVIACRKVSGDCAREEERQTAEKVQSAI